MKKALKLLAVTALAAVIGLSMAGCGDPPDDTGEDGSLGDTLTITNAQVYALDGDKPGSPFNGTVADLKYALIGTPNPLLTNVINGAPSVTLTNGKLNITLGTPKTSELSSLDFLAGPVQGITVSSSGAKIFRFSGFTTSTEWNGGTTVNQRSANGSVDYWYCDKDVNVTGKALFTNNGQTRTIDYAVYFKAGWNSIISTQTSLKTGKPTADDKWVVSNPPNNGNNGGDGSLGNTLTIKDAQVYTLDGDKPGSQYNGTVEGLNYALSAISIPSLTDGINGTPSVTLTNGILNVMLGTPKDSVLSSLDSAMGQTQGVTVSPSGAKFFQLSGFSPSASWNGTTVQQRRADGFVMYLYCDKDVNVTGKASGTNGNGQTWTMDVAMYLKAGWNSVIQTSTGSVGSQKTGKPAADDKWVVINPN